MSNNKFRINFYNKHMPDHPPSNRGYTEFEIPWWATVLISDLVNGFINEYKIENTTGIYNYFCGRDTLNNLIKLFDNAGIKIESYNIPELPTYGILIPIDHEIIVEYIFKYGYTKPDKK